MQIALLIDQCSHFPSNLLRYRTQIRFPFRQIEQKLLARKNGGGFIELRRALVAAVSLQEAGLDGVGQISRQNLVVDAVVGCFVANREDDFAALEEVARHPVSGAEVDFALAAVGEVEDAGVLKEAADDGADADVFREAFDAGAQDSEAADDEVDLDTGLGGGVEGFDDARLEQRVHLGDDVGGATGFGVLGLAAN